MSAATFRPAAASLAPTRLEKALGVAAAVLLGFVLTALLRGREHWDEASGLVWAHLATIVVALALTPVMLWRRRGDRLHRRLGRLWVASLGTTAALSFGIRTLNPGGFSFIHLLSAFTLYQVVSIMVDARRHRIAAHRTAVVLLVSGALLIAGFFTFPFDRMLGRWLAG